MLENTRLARDSTYWEAIGCKLFSCIQGLSRLDEDLVCSWDVAQRHQHELQGIHSADRAYEVLSITGLSIKTLCTGSCQFPGSSQC